MPARLTAPDGCSKLAKQDEAGSIKTYAAHASSRSLFVSGASAMGGSLMTNASRIHFNRRALLKSAAAGTAAALAAPMVVSRRQQIDQDRHVDHSFRPGRAARHFLAQRGDDRSGEDQRRRRPRRAADRDGHPRFEGAAAGSGTAGARTRQHRRLRDFDRCGGVVGRVRRARGGARSRHALPAHQLGNQRTDRRSEAAPAERVPHLPPGRPRFDRRRHLCRQHRQGQESVDVDDLPRPTMPMAATRLRST